MLNNIVQFLQVAVHTLLLFGLFTTIQVSVVVYGQRSPDVINKIHLYQHDFDSGTVILKDPGIYILQEDIIFCPTKQQQSEEERNRRTSTTTSTRSYDDDDYNDDGSSSSNYDDKHNDAVVNDDEDSNDIAASSSSSSSSSNTFILDSFQPNFPSSKYDTNAFALGYFAAIAIIGNNIEVRLNSHTIQQCTEHLLLQRFFSTIELALQPFTTGEGPHEFVGTLNTFQSSSNITISGPGTLHRSSHHLIHGNKNKNVVIRNIDFGDYEVAAIHLNSAHNLLIEDCRIHGNRKDVPVVGTFSAALFIRTYIKLLAEKYDYSMTLRNEIVTAKQLLDRLTISIQNVYDDVMTSGFIDYDSHPEEYLLYDNPLRVTEGTCYGIVVYGHGPASGGFAMEVEEDDVDASMDIILRRNTVKNVKCISKEVPAAVENGVVVQDVRGAMLQFFDVYSNDGLASYVSNSTYRGNVLSDAQIMVASAIYDNIVFDDGKGTNKENEPNPLFLTNLNTITPNIIEWAKGIPSPDTAKIPTYDPKYRCHGDAMHHVTIGMVGIRLEETLGFQIEENTVDLIINLTPFQFRPFNGCNDYHADLDEENGTTPQGANIRGISIAAARGFANGTTSLVQKNTITNLFSSNATHIIGIDVQGDAKGFHILDNRVDLKEEAEFNVSDVYNSLIIGENADDGGTSGTIVVQGNTFAQEFLIQNGSNKTIDKALFAGNGATRRLRAVHITDTGSTVRGTKSQGHTKTGKCPLGYT